MADVDPLAKVSRDVAKEAIAPILQGARQDVRAAQTCIQDVDMSQWSSDHCSPSYCELILKKSRADNDLFLPLAASLKFISEVANHTAGSSHHERGRAAPDRTTSMPVAALVRKKRSTSWFLS